MTSNGDRTASFESDCRLVISFLGGAGEASTVAAALRRIVLGTDSGSVQPVVETLLKAEVPRLHALGEMPEVITYNDSPIPPNAKVLQLFKAVLRCPLLAKNIFIWSLGDSPQEYVKAIRETILTHDDYGDIEGLAAFILEEWPWFMENAAFEWLTSEEPKLWHHVAGMYLTMDCGVLPEVNLERRRQLAEVMIHHKDPEVQASGKSELPNILEQIKKAALVGCLVRCINAGNYDAIKVELTEEVKAMLPPLARKLLKDFGPIEKVESATFGEQFEFLAHCARHMLSMTIVLNDQNKIADLRYWTRQVLDE